MKAFEVEVYDDGTAMVTCPHQKQEPPNKYTDHPQGPCGHGFIVSYEEWINTRPDFITRSCPYCFRAARVPEVLPTSNGEETSSPSSEGMGSNVATPSTDSAASS